MIAFLLDWIERFGTSNRHNSRAPSEAFLADHDGDWIANRLPFLVRLFSLIGLQRTRGCIPIRGSYHEDLC
jgi:hypothetical protein